MISRFGNFRFAFLIFVVVGAASAIGYAASPPQTTGHEEGPAAERDRIDHVFIDELKSLADWCRQNNLSDRATETTNSFLVRDPGRLYVFLPTATAQPVQYDEPLTNEWYSRFKSIKVQHADRLMGLANQFAKEGCGGEANQAVNEALYWNPELTAARKALGHRQTDDGWQPYSERLKIKRASRALNVLGWEKGTYWQASTDNFEIASSADEATTIRLAEQLQRWHWVWQQVFFDYWSDAKTIERWLSGKSYSRGSNRKFQVVLFADKAQYVETLSPKISGVGGSTGYYSDQLATSFFYTSTEEPVEETWRHELTHQLFKESVRTEASPFNDGYLWLGEGIAMYMESLKDFGDFVTLGGFDNRRMQYARTRQFREGFQLPIDALNALSMSEFQKHPEQRRIYSQSAGLSQFLMHGDNGKLREPLIELLNLIYLGKLKADSFEKIMGRSGSQLDQQYIEYLKVTNAEVTQFLLAPETLTELCLPGAGLDDAAFDSIARCERLQWIDVSVSELTAVRMQTLSACTHLDQLYATRCKVNAGSLVTLTQFKNLKSIDLSLSTFEPNSLKEFADLKQILEISLMGSNADDSCIEFIAQMTKLQSINLSKSKVSRTGILRLQQARPQLTILELP